MLCLRAAVFINLRMILEIIPKRTTNILQEIMKISNSFPLGNNAILRPWKPMRAD